MAFTRKDQKEMDRLRLEIGLEDRHTLTVIRKLMAEHGTSHATKMVYIKEALQNNEKRTKENVLLNIKLELKRDDDLNDQD